VTELSKQDLAKDLDQMAYLLSLYQLCNDTGPLARAYGLCMKESNDKTWSYKVYNLIFHIPTIGHTIPNGADDISLSLSIKAKGPFQPDDKIRNPLIDLEFNIEISGGYINAQHEYVYLKSSWHLDKHTPAHLEELTKFIHPEYHMTYGGRKMWDVTSYDYGQSLILPTPRICSPPMDAILGIDFVIQNYLKRDTHKKLTELADYKRLIANAQQRFWKPYYLAIAKAYNKIDGVVFNDCINSYSLVPNIQELS
jgi:hypothetical protein